MVIWGDIFSSEISNLSTKFKVMIISCVHCTLTNSLPLREIFSVLAPPGLHRRRPPPPSPPPLKGNQFTWETLHSTYYYLPTTRRRFLTWGESSQHLPNASRVTNFRANTTNQSRNRYSFIWMGKRVLKTNFWIETLLMPRFNSVYAK